MKKLVLLFSAALALSAFAAPTISDLKVTPIEPLGLAIDYTVSDATTNDFIRSLEVSFTTNGVAVVAKSLIGETACVNGSHRVYWNVAKDGISLDATNVSVKVAYNHVPLEGAQYCVIDLSGGPNAKSYPVFYLETPPDGGFNVPEYKTNKLVLRHAEDESTVRIVRWLGHTNESDNQPHAVTLTQLFYLGLFEVTQKQWELVMGTNPSSFTTDGAMKPVDGVTYDMIRGSKEGSSWPTTNSVDATSFLGKLRARTGLDFDLPTEAQWECMCRAGSLSVYSYGDSVDGSYMWYAVNSKSMTHEVGTRKPNKQGFYDMEGNVWEWCLDGYEATLTTGTDPKGATSAAGGRVGRGGCWGNGAAACTASSRNNWNPSTNRYYSGTSGFRLARTLP